MKLRSLETLNLYDRKNNKKDWPTWVKVQDFIYNIYECFLQKFYVEEFPLFIYNNMRLNYTPSWEIMCWKFPAIALKPKTASNRICRFHPDWIKQM